ncbi:hypothetical protein G7K_3412-t1 [Saitoella complicata NRRL Y-17804]|uniref:Uncharacterized protein n=1 Tax=Saitoella complicata (strain BCRC 22490 / CBS 7301 / JCM 7358 / NBRC 10748 / NRRL Y-17804) TaxID=698492 RepID=A0A0E9NHE8_SAICN|nr:hypothetical protein G7K_3412-t1 [Saitoella complicata NRRL Y-17804]
MQNVTIHPCLKSLCQVASTIAAPKKTGRDTGEEYLPKSNYCIGIDSAQHINQHRWSNACKGQHQDRIHPIHPPLIPTNRSVADRPSLSPVVSSCRLQYGFSLASIKS